MVLALIHQGQSHLRFPFDCFLALLTKQWPSFEGTVPSLPWKSLESVVMALLLSMEDRRLKQDLAVLGPVI